MRVVADARYISPITGTNTILVRDTPERVQVIGRFLAAFDKARPEVVVNVEVLEVDRNRLREYGLQLASPGSTGIDGSADDQSRRRLTLQSIRNLGQADVLLTNLPALYYRLLKTDSRTRTLANPHLRATDGVAAMARFGQEVPVPHVARRARSPRAASTSSRRRSSPTGTSASTSRSRPARTRTTT